MTKRKINSRDKGQRGERELVKKLSKWWGADFYRTPGSGSFATRGFKHEDLSLVGDLMTTDADFPFCVEVKWQEGWHLEHLLTSDVCKIWSWWEQTLSERGSQPIPLLLFKRNRQPWYYMLDVEQSSPLDSIESNRFVVYNATLDVVVVVGLFEDFLCTNKDLWK